MFANTTEDFASRVAKAAARASTALWGGDAKLYPRKPSTEPGETLWGIAFGG